MNAVLAQDEVEKVDSAGDVVDGDNSNDKTGETLDSTSTTNQSSSSENLNTVKINKEIISDVDSNRERPISRNMTRNNSNRQTGNIRPQGISNQKRKFLQNYGQSGLKGGLQGFPQGNWKGTPYGVMIQAVPVRNQNMLSNIYPENNFKGFAFQGIQLQGNVPTDTEFGSNGPMMQGNMRGDTLSEADDLRRLYFSGFNSGIPLTQQSGFGRRRPMPQRNRLNVKGGSFNGWRPLPYGPMFGRNYGVETIGGIKGYNMGDEGIQINLGQQFPVLM